MIEYEEDYDTDNYRKALVAAGAEVVAFKCFGGCDGRWIALLSSGYWVSDYYGSCAGCDEILGREDYGARNMEEVLVEVGKEKLTDNVYTDAEMLKIAAEHSHYSLEDEETLNWVRNLVNTRRS